MYLPRIVASAVQTLGGPGNQLLKHRPHLKSFLNCTIRGKQDYLSPLSGES